MKELNMNRTSVKRTVSTLVWRTPSVLCLLILLSWGCRKHEDLDARAPEKVEHRQAQDGGSDEIERDLFLQPQEPAPQGRPALSERTRMESFVIDEFHQADSNGAAVVLKDPETEERVWLSEGDQFRGFEVRKIDEFLGTIWLVHQGSSIVIGDAARKPSATRRRQMESAAHHEWADGSETHDEEWIEESDLRPEGYTSLTGWLDVEEEEFERLDFEIEQGIDPHDVSTWPPGYQGPGLERALRGIPVP